MEGTRGFLEDINLDIQADIDAALANLSFTAPEVASVSASTFAGMEEEGLENILPAIKEGDLLGDDFDKVLQSLPLQLEYQLAGLDYQREGEERDRRTEGKTTDELFNLDMGIGERDAIPDNGESDGAGWMESNKERDTISRLKGRLRQMRATQERQGQRLRELEKELAAARSHPQGQQTLPGQTNQRPESDPLLEEIRSLNARFDTIIASLQSELEQYRKLRQQMETIST